MWPNKLALVVSLQTGHFTLGKLRQLSQFITQFSVREVQMLESQILPQNWYLIMRM